ncbi:hypothetical protein AVEN_88038-1 [Araneus ventricosus]|uniref:Uncharacterized protein n=1 Tax=Araneus ventricosus TaxID=182803 RepID=A0A4Y2L437_ARAVE|nr:hypothetical protein AVEN_88038-1 [Araneus ventricosus]
MEKTEFSDSDTVRRTVMDTSLEIRMQDFRTDGKRVREEKYMKHKDSSHELKVDISVFAFPNGADKNTEGWLVVLPDVYLTCIHRPMNSALSWIVSIIDIEGNSRFPQSFERDGGRGGTLEVPPDADFSHTKYLERSFILSRADEFLLDGVLTLRCDIYLSWSGVSLGHPSRRFYDRQRSPFKKFFDSLPQRVCFQNDAEKGDPSDTFTLFDLTSKILTSPQFQDFIERFGFYGGSLKLPLPASESKEDITAILEHVWIFDARPDKFILSLDDRKDTVGTRLLRASSLDNLYNAKDLVILVWVKAHAGNPGNELADHFAKIASSCGADMSIPAPYSYVKRVCKKFLMNEWNSYWKNSTTDKRTKEILPSANLDLLISNKYVTYLFTNHGPFPAYLCRFKILNNPDCLCGEHGDVDHYLPSCMYTKDYHLLLPTGAGRTHWTRKLCKNYLFLNRLKSIFEISRKICDDLQRL